MKTRICSIKLNFIFLTIWGVIMTFIIPTWQTPDEKSHLEMIGTAFQNDNLAEILYEDMEFNTDEMRFHYEVKMDKKQWKAAMTKAPSYDRNQCLPKGVTPAVIKHLPAAIGILLGIGFHLPTFWVMELAELFSLAFYLVVCYWAVKIMPVKKEVLLFLMAFPMVMQQVGSINYDAVVLPLSFFLIAYHVKLCCQEEKIQWKNLTLLVTIIMVIAYIKSPYLLFGILFLGLPFEKFDLKIGKRAIDGVWIHRYRNLLRILVIVAIVAGYFLVRHNFYVEIVTVMCQEWRRTFVLMKESLQNFWLYYLQSLVGCFGWIDSWVPNYFLVVTYVLMFALVLVSFLHKKGKLPRPRYVIYSLLAFCVLGYITTISMVYHTVNITLYGQEIYAGDYNWHTAIYQIPYIGGLQGRYYLPFLALPLLAIGKWKKEENSFAMNGVILAYTIFAAVISIMVLYGRYWT